MKVIEDRSAQFMLLAGFIIAIGLVITTVMLSSIIFEGNMVIGAGNELSRNEIINMIQLIRDETRSAYRNTTAPGGTAVNATANFTNQTQKFSANMSKIYALHGGGVNMSVDINNWNSSRPANFTDNGFAGGTANWTVMESVRNISVFELRNVSGSNFEVNISNQTTGAFLWSLKLNGSNNITIRNASGYVGDYAVNFANISLLNDTWGTYRFSTNVGNNVSKISFRDGDDASGRFNITGNTTYGRNFIRARDYALNMTLNIFTSRLEVNITIPVSVPW